MSPKAPDPIAIWIVAFYVIMVIIVGARLVTLGNPFPRVPHTVVVCDCANNNCTCKHI